jgi:hypothetical protein
MLKMTARHATGRPARPVYHEDCFVLHRQEHKRAYWKQRTQSLTFRIRERMRARNRRKIQNRKHRK